MANPLYYNTPLEEFQTHYNGIQGPFKADIVTQLPKNIAVIRAVAAVALAGLVAFKVVPTIFFWPVVLAGIGFAGWTVYSHLYSKDPIVEAFYKISGGKDKFEGLPVISLGQNATEKISTAIDRLEWDKLEHRIAKAKTLDGRNVVIIKGLSRNKEGSFINCQTQGVLAFVEKLGPYDVRSFHELAESIARAILTPLKGNTFQTWSTFSASAGDEGSRIDCAVYSSISKDMANELFAQLGHN